MLKTPCFCDILARSILDSKTLREGDIVGKPDWSAIEADFLATGTKYPTLAKKWGVSLSTLKKKASAGEWAAKLAEVSKRAEPEPETEPAPNAEPTEIMHPEELAAELRAKRSLRMIEVTDMMMDHIIDALGVIHAEDTLALATLVRALKDLREIQGLNKSALDIEEQQARIAKLRSETRIVDDGTEGGVIFMPTMAERPQAPEDGQ